MTSAVRCLAISEIQRNILRLCHLEESPTRHRRTAYNIALTCKTLSDTALDELWRVVRGLRPLLKLFPDVVVAKSIQNGRHHHFVSLFPCIFWHCLYCLFLEGSSEASMAERLGHI